MRLALAAGGLGSLACGELDVTPSRATAVRVAAHARSHEQKPPPIPKVSRAKRIAASIARVQARAAAKHAWLPAGVSGPAISGVSMSKPGSYTTASSINTLFGEGTARIAPRPSARFSEEPAEYFDFAPRAWGCADELEPLASARPNLDGATPNRLSYEHESAGLSEWYLSGPLGIEQGLVVHRLPGCDAARPTLRFRIPGSPGWKVEQRRTFVELVSPSGRRLRYGHAYAEDARGRELAISVRGDGVGVSLEVSTTNAVLPLRVDPLTWTKSEALEAPSGLPGDGFGRSVALSDTTILAGAPDLQRSEQEFAGLAYSYSRASLSQPVVDELEATPTAGAHFGGAVAIYGDLAVVGAPGAANGALSGAVYVFVRSGPEQPWSKPPTPLTAGANSAPGDLFGASLSLFEDMLLVGAPGSAGGGAAFVFVRSNGSWSDARALPVQCLQPFEPGQTTPFTLTGHAFGSSVALRNRVALVGARSRGIEGSCPPAAYVYELDADGTASSPQLIPHSIAAEELPFQKMTDGFGNSVALSDDTFVVGAGGLDLDDEGLHVGAAFVYDRDTWSTIAPVRLTAPSNTSFGMRVAASDELLAISQPNADPPELSRVYLYPKQRPDPWHEPAVFEPDPGAYTSQPGAALAVYGVVTLVGNEDAEEVGTLNLIQLENGSECHDALDCQSGNCTDGVCCNSACAGCNSCLNAHTGAPDGTCAPVSKGTDPHHACGEDACSRTGEQANSAACNGSGACATHVEECAPFSCRAGACARDCTEDAECDAAAFCRDGHCIFSRKTALECNRNEECKSGFCSDQVCCDEACDGQCQACNVPGNSGHCVPVTGAPHGSRPSCAALAEDEPCSQTACDGADVARCAAFVGSEVACEEPACAEGFAPRPASCDAFGQCVSGTECPTGCQTSYDCEDDYECSAETAQCVAQATPAARVSAGCALSRSTTPGSPLVGLVALAALRARRRSGHVARSPRFSIPG